MAMPRPSGRAQEIAQRVIPGMAHLKKDRASRRTTPRASLSEVEIKQTNQIENKEGFR